MTNPILKNLTQSISKKEPHLTKVVFDLDSTLYDVTPRTERILKEFCQEFKTQYEKETKAIELAGSRQSDWGVDQVLQRAGLANVDFKFMSLIKDYWHQRFFTNEYLIYDIPYKGGVRYVQGLAKAGAEIFYLTGRDIARMGEGSKKQLINSGFPLDGRQSSLVLKPHRKMNDAEFKKNWLLDKSLEPHQTIWFFENEPVNIRQVEMDIKHIQLIFFDSSHSGRLQSPTHIPTIDSYEFEEACEG